jgi:hypothetical protein
MEAMDQIETNSLLVGIKLRVGNVERLAKKSIVVAKFTAGSLQVQTKMKILTK